MKRITGTDNNAAGSLKNRWVRPIIVFALGGALCCGLTAFAVRAYNKGAGGRPPSVAAPSAQINTQTEVAVVTLRPTGFERTEIMRPRGMFWLVVENRSGLQTIDLRINSADSSLQNIQKMARKNHDWQQALDLRPGQYVLTEAYHPEWSCTITIE